MIGAVFDIDRTLIPGTSMERLFLRWQLRRGNLSPRDLLRAAPSIGWQVVTLPRRGYVQWHGHLAGKREEDVEKWVEQCFAEEIAPRVSRAGMDRLSEHRSAGHLTVLLSGSIRPLVQRMASYVDAGIFVCTSPRVEAGRYTGRLIGAHVGGAEKAARVAAIAAEHNLELADSFCYADHHTDLQMLELFGHPMPTNPDQQLERVALARGWPISRFG